MILAATGMQREARIIARAGLVPVISGGDAARLCGLLTAQAERASAIVSIGIAGALSADLRVGDVVVGDEVIPTDSKEPSPQRRLGSMSALADDIAGGESHGPQPSLGRRGEGWAEHLLAALAGARRGIACGSDAMVIAAAAKTRLYEACGTALPLIIDMESHVAAQVAQEHGLPFAFIRVISDRADQDLPPAVTCGLKPDGGMAILPVLAALLRNPAQLPALIRTARDTDRAMRALLAACDVLARSGVGLADRG